MRITALLALAFWASTTTALNVGDLCTGLAGVVGVCIPTSQCGGTYISSACPGTPDNVRCCTASSCKSGTGRCSKVGDPKFSCSGTHVSGFCPGPSNFQCCVAKSPRVAGTTVGGLCIGERGVTGACIATSACAGGRYISGACPGTPDNIRCCTGSTCLSRGKCRKVDDARAGCTGAFYTGSCPGPSNYQCCVPKVKPPPPPPPKTDPEGARKHAYCAAAALAAIQAIPKIGDGIVRYAGEAEAQAQQAKQCADAAAQLDPGSAAAKQAANDAREAMSLSQALARVADTYIEAERKAYCRWSGNKC